MANTSIVRGLKLRGSISGDYIPQSRKCFIPSTDGTAVFIGDPVKVAGSASSTQIDCQTVAQCAASDAIYGVVTAIDQFDEIALGSQNLYRQHRPASTAMFVYVCDDPNAEYEIQEDAVGGALAAVDVGLNADIIVGSGDTNSGLSGVQLDTSTKATTATLPLKILGFVNIPDNIIGANAKVRVKINNAQLGSSTGTAGV